MSDKIHVHTNANTSTETTLELSNIVVINIPLQKDLVTDEVNFFNIDDPEYEPTILYGDVDLDGIVDSNDALITLRYTMGLIPEDEFSELSIINADIDCNGIVESNDALNILRMVLHLL